MMPPDVRKGIESLLSEGPWDNALGRWLKLQLEHNDWDNSIERMGGGKTARDAYMNPIFDAQCAVTAFDMHAQLTGDGRERGLWLWLCDESKARAETYDQWAENALELFCRLAGIDDKTGAKFHASTVMDEFKNVADAKVHEAALLEWPAVKKLYAVIGKAIAKHEAAEAPIKARTPRKPDRRTTRERRRDDKRKARLNKV